MSRKLGHCPDSWQTVKIFLCSTIKDMCAEREYLIKHILPEIKEWASKWKIHICDYDLCWELPPNLFAAQQLISHAQRNTQKSIYIFLLARRCSWMAGLREFANNISYTSLYEVYSLSQFIGQMSANHTVLFYFREDDHFPKLQEIEEEERQLYAKVFVCDQQTEQIERLKSLIIETTSDKQRYSYTPQFDPQLKFPLACGNISITSLHPFGQRVTDDLQKWISYVFQQRIESLWTKRSNDPLFYERDLHNSFAELKAQSLIIEQKPALLKLFDYSDGLKNQLFAVYGEESIGKSTLLAKFYKEYKFDKYGWEINENTIFINHFVDASPKANDLKFLLQRLCRELKYYNSKITESIPEDISELVQTFAWFLDYVGKKTIIIIDGLDRLKASYNADKLYWLPNHLPTRVRIIVSTGPGTIQKILQKKTTHATKLSYQSKRRISREYIEHMTSVLGIKQEKIPLKLLSRQNDIGHPLYLKLLLCELRCIIPEYWHRSITKLPKTVADFFLYYLEELEQEDKEELVPMALSLISVSYFGLAQSELESMLLEIDKEQCIQVILRRLNDFLVKKGHRWDFRSRYIAELVADRYLDGKQTKECHRFIADYFAGQPILQNNQPNILKLIEEPKQLYQIRAYQKLFTTLCDISFLEEKSRTVGILELLYDFKALLEITPRDFRYQIDTDVYINYSLIDLLNRVLELESSFLQKYPQCLFQMLWNYGYWHDHPDAEKYYCSSNNAPWKQKSDKLYRLVEKWAKEKSYKSQVWLKAKRPLPIRLDSPVKKILYGHKGTITGIHATSNYIISGSDDCYIYFWDIATGNFIHKLEHYENVNSIDISRDGKRLVSAAYRTIKIWDIVSGEPLLNLQEKVQVNKSRIKPKYEMWQVSTNINVVRFSPRGDKIIAGSSFTPREGQIELDIGKIYIWDANNGKYLGDIYTSSQIKDLAFSPDGRKLVTDSLEVFTISGKKVAKGNKEKATAVCYSLRGDMIIAAHGNQICLYDSKKMRLKKKFKPCKGNILALNIRRDGRYLVSGSDEKTVCLWDMDNGKMLYSWYGHEESVTSVCFSKDGNHIISGSDDETIFIWDIDFDLTHYQLKENTSELTCMQMGPDQKNWLAGYRDGSIKIWNIEEETVTTIGNHKNKVRLINFSGDGKKAVSVASDGQLCLWSIDKKQPIYKRMTESLPKKIDFHVNNKAIIITNNNNTYTLLGLQQSQRNVPQLATDIIANWSVDFIPVEIEFANGQTYIIAKDNNKILTTWPGCINTTTISQYKHIVGFARSHVYIFELCGDVEWVV